MCTAVALQYKVAKLEGFSVLEPSSLLPLIRFLLLTQGLHSSLNVVICLFLPEPGVGTETGMW